MATDADFHKFAEDVKNLKAKPGDNELLELYGLYKQSTVGDCDTDRPGMFDFQGKAKWDNWNSQKGLSKEDAKVQYITVAKRLIEKYGLKQ